MVKCAGGSVHVHEDDLLCSDCGHAAAQGPVGENTKPCNPKDEAARLDNRVDLSLFPDTAVIAGAMALIEGDAKYGGFNYRIAGVRASVYTAALKRHMAAWENGEDIDEKSGLNHLWKALACLAILIDCEARGNLTDDRPPPAPVAEMLDQLRARVQAIREEHKGAHVKRFTHEDD